MCCARLQVIAYLVEYVQRIDATLEPFGGRFLVHGGKVECWRETGRET
jgi:uncharacterized protein (DUF1330 family)